jgi:hypothetical protein
MEKKTSYRDAKAPKFLRVSVADDQGETIQTMVLAAKEFSTGSVGFYGSEKLVNPCNPDASYQLGFTATLIGSKRPA